MRLETGFFVIALAACSSLASAQTWTPPRTPDGHPDLQGVWTNATITPLERPRELGAKEFFTEEEAAENRKRAAARRRTTSSPSSAWTGARCRSPSASERR